MTTYGRTAFDEEDRKRVLSLMQEYSTKLRDLCDNLNSARSRRFQTFALVLFGFMAMSLMASVLTRSKIGVPNNFEPVSIVAVAAAASLLLITLLTYILADRRLKHQYDVHEVAAILRRLLQAVSQYHEHQSNDRNYLLADQFEIDIRLAEAEAALKLYEVTIMSNEKSLI